MAISKSELHAALSPGMPYSWDVRGRSRTGTSLGSHTTERPSLRSLSLQVLLALVFGMSAHAAKNALAPAEPMLHRLGLSPVAYALLSAFPQFGCIVLPTLWGSAYRRREKCMLAIIPGGMLIGQVLILAGFALLERLDRAAGETQHRAEMLLLFFGLLTFSIFHGGAHVVQCSVLTRILPFGLTSGFVGTIASTHLIVAACNFLIPAVWKHDGLLGVQVLLLVPAVLSFLAGLALAKISDDFSVPHEVTRLPTGVSDGLLNEVFLNDSSPEVETPGLLGKLSARTRALCQPVDIKFVYLLSLWKALEVGSLHSLRTIKNALVVSLGETVGAAGILLGAFQSIGLLLLPLAGALFDCAGRRTLILSLSWSLAIASAFLSVGQCLPSVAWKACLLVVSVAEVLLPVIPLALVPGHCEPSVGTSYGLLESSFSLAQVLLTLATGFAREQGGLTEAMLLFTVTFTIGGFAACAVARKLNA
eukprot:TRINITY_DN20689_c0_g1_i1.p1 TRINITY_DN20689_c0_g1~~TRINITY_DN20689_c0_g1_i1.p1  ORF type:complete len:477 (-),score=53.96 TRINITY_DN20689_c0_g1_i1:198-1628(-)